MHSDEYQKYLDAAGSDEQEHYSVKIDAVRLIMDHIDDTFVTPVFNGSVSVRDAASYLVVRIRLKREQRRRQLATSDFW